MKRKIKLMQKKLLAAFSGECLMYESAANVKWENIPMDFKFFDLKSFCDQKDLTNAHMTKVLDREVRVA